MRCPASSFLLLATLVATAHAFSSRLRASAAEAAAAALASRTHDEPLSSCTCRCCLSQRQDVRDDEIALHGLKCSPKAAVGPAGDNSCSDQCAADPAPNESQSAPVRIVDYTNFCFTACHPEGKGLDVDSQCLENVAGDYPEIPSQPKVASLYSASAMSKRAPVDQAMTQTGQQLNQPPDNSGAVLPLAKAQMIEAMVKAKAAGEAAMIAKESYERILRSSRQSAVQASKATLKEIKREAGEQAKLAVQIRERYEAAAKENARKAAIGIAKVYKNALTKTQGIAALWAERANEYATAAGQRKKMANDLSVDAFKYGASQEFKMARDTNMQAHQAMDQAAAFARTAKSAWDQSVAINNGLEWYSYAETAAAANMLAKAMPPDVPPPDLPPLP